MIVSYEMLLFIEEYENPTIWGTFSGSLTNLMKNDFYLFSLSFGSFNQLFLFFSNFLH